jgi:hypothetical protein
MLISGYKTKDAQTMPVSPITCNYWQRNADNIEENGNSYR